MDDLPLWVHYVSALGPAITLLAGLVAALVAWRTYLHRRAQDRKDEWWRRAQWALDRALSDDVRARRLGFRMLTLQARSALADEEDQRVMEAASAAVLRAVSSRTGDDEAESGYHVKNATSAEVDGS